MSSDIDEILQLWYYGRFFGIYPYPSPLPSPPNKKSIGVNQGNLVATQRSPVAQFTFVAMLHIGRHEPPKCGGPLPVVSTALQSQAVFAVVAPQRRSTCLDM